MCSTFYLFDCISYDNLNLHFNFLFNKISPTTKSFQLLDKTKSNETPPLLALTRWVGPAVTAGLHLRSYKYLTEFAIKLFVYINKACQKSSVLPARWFDIIKSCNNFTPTNDKIVVRFKILPIGFACQKRIGFIECVAV